MEPPSCIWTTTPWTIPGNRAIAFSPTIDYGLYEVTDAPDDNWAKPGDMLVLADVLAETVVKAARVTPGRRTWPMWPARVCSRAITCARIPTQDGDYDFDVPVARPASIVTEDTGTGFVHIAPGHGTEDFEIWEQIAPPSKRERIDTTIPFTVDADGLFTKDAPGLRGQARHRRQGRNFGDANEAVIQALIRGECAHRPRAAPPRLSAFLALEEAGHLPQHAAMVHRHGCADRGRRGDTLRERALKAIGATRFVPSQGENRLRGMVETRPDWVVSRQRAWGVPITVFRNKETGEVIPNREFNASGELIERIVDAFAQEGADAWFEQGAKERFLGGLVENPDDWEKVDDILDVWFDFRLDPRLRAGAAAGPQMAGLALSRRLRPASRLVPILALGIVRHARPRALRCRAHPWLRRRRGRAQDVEIIRQCGRAPGRHQTVRRRDPAALGHEFRLCRGSAHRPGDHQGQCGVLPQAQEHAALPARQPRP